MTPTFVHCHLHSEFSLTDSTIRIGQLVKRCAELGMPAVAVTDNCNFFALVKFFKAAESAGWTVPLDLAVWGAVAQVGMGTTGAVNARATRIFVRMVKKLKKFSVSRKASLGVPVPIISAY